MQVVYVGEHCSLSGRPGIFLAGPSPRGKEDYNWRPEALKYLQQIAFLGNVYVPLREDGGWLGDFNGQIDWELQYLDSATVVAFWIPREPPELPGRTTDKEWGMYVRSGKAVVGYPLKTRSGKDTPGVDYIYYVSRKFGVPIFHNMTETLCCAVKMCDR